MVQGDAEVPCRLQATKIRHINKNNHSRAKKGEKEGFSEGPRSDAPQGRVALEKRKEDKKKNPCVHGGMMC